MFSFRDKKDTALPTGVLTIAEYERLAGWKGKHGQTFVRDLERPKRLFEVTHPDRVPCIEMADRRTYGHWQFLRVLIEEGLL